MNVEHVHEHADLQSVALEPGIAGPSDLDDAAVGGRNHGARGGGNGARRVAEELQDEERAEPQRHRPPPAEGEADNESDRHGNPEEWPALAGDDGMRVRGVHY